MYLPLGIAATLSVRGGVTRLDEQVEEIDFQRYESERDRRVGANFSANSPFVGSYHLYGPYISCAPYNIH